ncbi:Acyl-CoA dehydrogenase [Amycolatopsis arida]|uniref:Acyl-CoA dehydrogenase n=1 Tax=Amycolatopsis arida TaxID=587909 RepID=A0A1I5QA34_9PSEU|nr:acyl-CoA dehydrogenase family protein [Amycolatopsis arida]TDX98769.1 alkylation response protein AidB-like acyl-CoA dehydrogenase [Amycolatopsis arida]SFP43168.1 Acyl-CoA dehydrogenase [Amycolatopsis arida]
MANTDVPARAELAERAEKLVPLLRQRAEWTDENRRLPEETIEALTEAGLLKLRVPRRYGGFEADTGTVVDVLSELARGDGSTSWTAAVWAISSWVVGLFPDEVQDEVFATPNVRVCGILSPTAVAAPADGGVVVNGQWTFNTAAQQSHWNTNAAVRPTPDGGFEPVMLVIPVSDLRIVDDWHTTGMRGSGSVTTVAENVFVPAERILPMGPVLNQQYASTLNANSPHYRSPFLPMACATVGATALGLAKAANEVFFDRLAGRKITYTSYENQSEAPLTHLQVAEAAVRIDEAGFHAYRAADLIDTKATAGEPWTLAERGRARLDLGATVQRAKEAVDILKTASGGSSVYHTVPIQRIDRDIHVLSLHAVMHPNTNLELYGRILCGLEPNTHYI